MSFSAAAVFAIGLLVGNVPEGLLPTITLALGVGVRVLARQSALVKRLSAVETLGSTTVICTDKTGTLTENRMHVVAAWTTGGDVDLEATGRDFTAAGPLVVRALAVALARCTSAAVDGPDDASVGGDPTETAMLLAARRLGADVARATRETSCRRVFHFDPTLKLMSTVDDVGVASNPLLLWGIAFEVVFAAAVAALPGLRTVFGTSLPPLSALALLISFPIIVWGADESRRWLIRRHGCVRDPEGRSRSLCAGAGGLRAPRLG